MPPSTLNVHWSAGEQTLHPPTQPGPRKLTEVLRQANLPLNIRCGERGRCDGCVVELVQGRLTHVTSGQQVATESKIVNVRGCEYGLASGDSASIRIPPRALLAYQPHVVTEFRINVPRAHDPLWQEVSFADGEINHRLPFRQAVCEAVARKLDMVFPPRLATDLGAAPLQAPTASLEFHGDQWLITDLHSGPPRGGLGAAIDVGTTTVAVLLVDLATGKVVGKSARFNQQMRLGDDVLTRIHLCHDNPQMLRRMQQAVADQTLAPLLEEALRQSGASVDQLRCLSIAGNTTMLHLLAGVDPTPMGVAPFTPVFINHRVLAAKDLWPADGSHRPAPRTPVHLLPGAAAYVGADLTAGALASGLFYDDGPSLLVDVGTNGEIIFKHKDRLLGCATAAGPAFEGAGLSCGMRAGDGAISHIDFDTLPFHLRTEMIGAEKGVKAAGICGSAYIDFLAAARRIGLLNGAGRFDGQQVSAAADLLIPWNGDTGMRVGLGQAKRDIVITQADVASLLQAKAAIAAGILTLLAQEGITPADIKTVYLAGGFGTHLRPANAIGCGMLPGFAAEQIQPVGNTALAGAMMALLDCGSLTEITRISKQIRIIELNLDPDFESRFIDHLSLPE